MLLLNWGFNKTPMEISSNALEIFSHRRANRNFKQENIVREDLHIQKQDLGEIILNLINLHT